MFTRRNRSSLRQALEFAGDSEIRSLRGEVAERQEHIAQLELELFDTRSALALFERELAARIRPLEGRLRDSRSALDQARHRAERRAQWGSRLESEELPDVVEQFYRAWTPSEPASPRRSTDPPSETNQEQLKQLFRELAKRFHPDLTPDPQRKRWRQEMMAKVNEAYAAGDQQTLSRLAQESFEPPQDGPKSREEILVELSREIQRLDGVRISLQNELDRLLRSQTVQLQLEVSMARQAGRDMLGEMAADLQMQIAQVEAELRGLASAGG